MRTRGNGQPPAGVGLPPSSRSSGCPDRGKPYGCGASGCALPKKISARWNPLWGGISGLHPSSTLDSHSNKMGKPRRAWLPAIAAFPPCGAAGRPAGKRAGTPILKALMAGSARSINAKHKAPQPAAAGRGAASKPMPKPAVAKAVKPGPTESAGIRPISLDGAGRGSAKRRCPAPKTISAPL